jgi:hypothetical protein
LDEKCPPEAHALGHLNVHVATWKEVRSLGVCLWRQHRDPGLSFSPLLLPGCYKVSIFAPPCLLSWCFASP